MRKPSPEGQAGVAKQGIASHGIGSPSALEKKPVGGGDDDEGGCNEGLVRTTTRTLRCCNKELYTMTGRRMALFFASACGTSTWPLNALN